MRCWFFFNGRNVVDGVLKIFELTGHCVFSQSFSGNNTIELTSEDLSTGLYFITIHSEEGNFMKKLVVQ